jgi:hypothetical protein
MLSAPSMPRTKRNYCAPSRTHSSQQDLPLVRDHAQAFRCSPSSKSPCERPLWVIIFGRPIGLRTSRRVSSSGRRLPERTSGQECSIKQRERGGWARSGYEYHLFGTSRLGSERKLGGRSELLSDKPPGLQVLANARQASLSFFRIDIPREFAILSRSCCDQALSLT